MVKLLQLKKKFFLGLTLSRTRLTLVEITYLKSEWVITQLISKEFDNNSSSTQQPSTTLELHAFKKRKTYYALESPSVFTRSIQIEVGLTDEDIIEDIELIFENIIPISLKESRYDYEILGPNANQAEFMDLLLIAAPKTLIESEMAKIEALGLTLTHLETQALSLERVFNFCSDLNPESDKSTLNTVKIMAVLEETKSSLFVFQTGSPPYEKNLTLKSDPTSENIVEELGRGINLFFAEHPNLQSHTPVLFLTGVGALKEGLLTAIEETLNIKTTIFNPLATLKFSSKLSSLQDNSLLMSATSIIALGLSLRGITETSLHPQTNKSIYGINLLPWREEKRKELNRLFFIQVACVVALCFGILALIHGFLTFIINTEQANLDYLAHESNKLNTQIQTIQGLEKDKQRLLARMGVIHTLEHQRLRMLSLLDALPRLIPEGIYLKDMIGKGHTVSIIGLAQTNAAISKLLKNLQANELSFLFEDVKLIEVLTDKKLNALKFKIEFCVTILGY